MGYRSPDLHSSALSPAEYRVYPAFVGSLLEEEGQREHPGAQGKDGAHPVAVAKVTWWLSDRMGLERKAITQILAKFPSYPSSTLSIGEIYALFRLLSHAKQRGDHPLEDDLAFVQTLPLQAKATTAGSHSTRGPKSVKVTKIPPPVPERNGQFVPDKSNRAKREMIPGGSQQLPPSQSMTVSTVNSSLRSFRDAKPSPSTPLLNPFRQSDKTNPSSQMSSGIAATASISITSSESSTTRMRSQGTEVSHNNNPFRKRLSLLSAMPIQEDGREDSLSTQSALAPSLPPLTEILAMRPSCLPDSYSVTPASPSAADHPIESNLARPGLTPRSHPQHLTFTSSTKSAAPSGPSDSSSSSSDESQNAYEKSLKAAKQRHDQKKATHAPTTSQVAELQVVRRSGSTQKSHTSGGQSNHHAAVGAPGNGLYVARAPPSRI